MTRPLLSHAADETTACDRFWYIELAGLDVSKICTLQEADLDQRLDH